MPKVCRIAPIVALVVLALVAGAGGPVTASQDPPPKLMTKSSLASQLGTVDGAPAVQLTVTVTVVDETTSVPTGMVEFFEHERSLGLAELVSGETGLKAVLVQPVDPGPHSLVARYLGDSVFAISLSNPVDFVVAGQ